MTLRRIAAIATFFLVTAVLPAEVLSSGVQHRTIQTARGPRSFELFVPKEAGPPQAMPVIVAVHGAGGSGSDQVEAWRPLAEAEGVILIAPNIPNSPAAWDELYDHPEWLKTAIESVGREHAIDTQRVYLWGYSAGGMFTFYLAFLESRYFAAAAVHGGVIEHAKYQMADFASRKIPIALYIGTKDQWWTPGVAHATRDALTARGFPVHYVEMAGADHNFFARSAQITRDAWRFLRVRPLEAEPRFEPLDLSKIKSALR